MTHGEQADSSVIDYIESNMQREVVEGVHRYPDLARLQAEGQFWAAQRLPKPYHYHALKTCYFNAMVLTIHHESLRYCEGYAGSTFPETTGWFHHGWCVDPDGLVIDVTWRTSPRAKYYNNPACLVYFGIPIDRLQVALHLTSSGFRDNNALLFLP